MATILADDTLKCIVLNENDRIPIWISLKFTSRSLVDNKAALVQVMGWCITSEKPLPEPMLTQFTDACSGNGLALNRRQAINWTDAYMWH